MGSIIKVPADGIMTAKIKPRKQRPRGRPGPSPSEDFREQILNAAERLFATQGFAATTIREIAADVGVNAAMVHYYFGAKMQLLQAVMDRVLEPLSGSVSALQQGGQVDLQDIVSLLFSMAGEHPFLPQLIAREVFLPGGKMQQQFLQHFAPRLGGRLPDILRQLQQSGHLAAGLDPAITALLILSLCFFPFIARHAAEQVLGIAFDAAGLRNISQHIFALLQRGLVP
jgi:AcrR family transcriptional regulator